MGPMVTILIPFYNCRYVNQAIESALNQTYRNIEVLVIDDGSTQFLEKLEPYFAKIRYIRKENGGTASALNRGIQEAQGDYIAWLSSDDLFLPGKVEKQLAFMREQQIEASFTRYNAIDEHNQVSIPWHDPRIADHKELLKSSLLYNPINGCTVMIKKEVFDQAGLFDPTYRYTHDFEMWLRLNTKGPRLHFLDVVLTYFRMHSESGTSRHQQEMLAEMHRIMDLYRPAIEVLTS